MKKIHFDYKESRTNLLTIFTSFAILWYFLFGPILEITREEPTNFTYLFFLSSVHYTSFILMLVCIYLVFNSFIVDLSGSVAKRKIERNFDLVYRILIMTWPKILAILIILFICFNIQEGNEIRRNSVWNIGAPFVILIISIVILKKEIKIFGVGQSFICISALVPLWVIYTLTMSTLFADVKIYPAKEVYKSDEKLIVRILSSGYLANPAITKIEFCGSIIPRDSSIGNGYYKIGLKRHFAKGFDHYFFVYYQTQPFGITKVKYKEIPVYE